MLQLYSYGVLTSLGLLIGLYYFWKMGRDEHLEEIALFDAYFLSLLAYFVVGRGVYAFLVAKLPFLQALAILTLPGMTTLAGIVSAIMILGLIIKAKGWEYFKVMDFAVVSLSIVLLFGSIGNLVNKTNSLPVDILSIVVTVIMFVVTYQVRKNFRFYTWYKGDKAVAPDGLATHTFGLLAGIYYLTRSIWDHSLLIPLIIWGAVLLTLSLINIYLRSGRKVGIPSVKWGKRR